MKLHTTSGYGCYFRYTVGLGVWEPEKQINPPTYHAYSYYIWVSDDPEDLPLEPMTWAGIKSAF